MRRLSRVRVSSEAGFSLVEVLVTVALTSLTVVTLAGVVMGIMANSRREGQQTDAYESLRLAGQQILIDGRFANRADADNTGSDLRFYYDTGTDNYNRYSFYRAENNDPNNPVPDGNNLHRWVVRNGGLVTDEIIARDLVPPGPGYPDTQFEAVSLDTSKYARAILVRQPLTGQSYPIELEVKVMQR